MSLLTLRENIKKTFQKNDRIITPILKFIISLILFASLSDSFNYVSILNKGIIILVLALACAFLPMAVTVFISGCYVLVQLKGVAIELVLIFAILFAIIYCLYLRFCPKYGIIIMLAPFLFAINMPYLIPILVAMFVGPVGAIPAICGTIFYYFAKYVEKASVLITTKADDDSFQAYSYVINGVIKDKNLLLTIIAFLVIIILEYIIYKQSKDYSWYIAIMISGLICIMLFLFGGLLFETNVNIVGILLGTIGSCVIAVAAQFFKCVVDYSRTEVVQYEDDEYYYYVKAVPKIKVNAEDVNIKKISARK